MHHDGIEEHDNHLPNWWLATLFGSIVFAGGYWFYYETTKLGQGSYAALAAEEQVRKSKQAAAALGVNDDDLTARGPQAVERGKALFDTNCVACHAAKGQGSIGPNLTDAFWLHGGKPKQIYTTVMQGVTDKGMLAWGPVLGDEKAKDVVAFLLSIKNTNVEGGKPPQGEKE